MRNVPYFLVAVIVLSGGALLFDGTGFRSVHALSVDDVLEEMYCGSTDCYGLLGVPQNATKTEIRKAYHRLSFQLHPDRNRSPNASVQFSKIAKAQEVLLNDESRGAYDYYLSHPHSLLTLYYGIRAIYPSRTHPGIVFALFLVLASLGQYINNRWRHRWRVEVVELTPQFKRSMDVEVESRCGGKLKKMDKQAIEAIRSEVKSLLLDTVHLNGEIVGSSPPPFALTQTVAFQCLILPYTLLLWILSSLKWTWKYRLLKDPYTEADQEIMTQWLLSISKKEWNALEEKDREELMAKKLWIKENLNEHNRQKDEEETRLRKKWKRKNA